MSCSNTEKEKNISVRHGVRVYEIKYIKYFRWKIHSLFEKHENNDKNAYQNTFIVNY